VELKCWHFHSTASTLHISVHTYVRMCCILYIYKEQTTYVLYSRHPIFGLNYKYQLSVISSNRPHTVLPNINLNTFGQALARLWTLPKGIIWGEIFCSWNWSWELSKYCSENISRQFNCTLLAMYFSHSSHLFCVHTVVGPFLMSTVKVNSKSQKFHC
jgi:hypothetical protein